MKDVLTKEELSTFFNACENYMYKTIFMMIYGSGLRVSEAVNLRIEDIDSRKMRIFVRAGKGGKDRYTVLPKTSLEMLRKYYKMYKPKHPEGYIFLNREGNPLKIERTRVFFRRYMLITTLKCIKMYENYRYKKILIKKIVKLS